MFALHVDGNLGLVHCSGETFDKTTSAITSPTWKHFANTWQRIFAFHVVPHLEYDCAPRHRPSLYTRDFLVLYCTAIMLCVCKQCKLRATLTRQYDSDSYAPTDPVGACMRVRSGVYEQADCPRRENQQRSIRFEARRRSGIAEPAPMDGRKLHYTS